MNADSRLPTFNSQAPTFSYPLLFLLCALLSGCKEEQVMYKTRKSPEELRQMQAEIDMAEKQEAERARQAEAPEAPEPPDRPRLDASVPTREDTAAGLAFTVPAAWERREGTSSLRLAEYKVPGATPDAAGEVVLFAFGQGQGGGVSANVLRWLKQLKQPDGSDSVSKAETYTTHLGPLHVTEVHATGTYAPPAMGPGQQAPPPREGFALAGIIVEGGPSGTLFLKMTGPAATMDASAPAFATLVGSFHKIGEAPPAAIDEAPLPEGTQRVAGLLFKTPKSWKKVKPKSQMRAAEYAITDASGSAELTLFSFGKDQGGDTPSNIARWVAQFTQPDGKNPADLADVAETTVNGLKVTQVRVTGSYSAGSAMSDGKEPEPLKDAALWGLIVEGTPRGSVFFKMTGNRATVEAQAQAQEDLILSLAPAGS